jgi:ABC-2 type transport system permease protein
MFSHASTALRTMGGRRYPRLVAQTMTTGDDRAGDATSVPPAVADVPNSRSWQRAFGDLRQGWKQRPLWGYLGWQDIKQRYRRSVLGPLWISISMAVVATAMGILYGALFGEDITTFLPYVATGLLIWNFVNGCILEGSEVFIANEGLIKFLPAPLSLHVYRLLWRQILFFLHNMVVWAVLMIVFPQPLSWTVLLAIPAFALLIVNGTWIALLTGIIATRYRDIPPIIASLANLLFFMTPIVWQYETLLRNPAVAERARIAELNPVMHFVEILRQPLLGDPIVGRHWMVVGVITVVGCFAALVCLRNYRARVAYWV